MTVSESTPNNQDPPRTGHPIPGPPSASRTLPDQATDALREAIHGHVERVRVSAPAQVQGPRYAPLDALELRGECTNQLSVLACAIADEAALIRQIAEHRETIKRAEVRATLLPTIDGKNVETRKAQIDQALFDDPTYLTATEALRKVEEELVLARGNADVARERVRLYRSLLAVLASQSADVTNGAQA